MLAEPAGKGARGHRCVGGETLDGDRLVEVLLRPFQRLGEVVGVRRLGQCHLDVLRLPAASVRGATIWRATLLAISAPCSRRIRCRHRSMAAAEPTLVRTGPSWRLVARCLGDADPPTSNVPRILTSHYLAAACS